MGTKTNFYKNPSLVYKKDFSLSSVLQNLRAYNIATGNVPPIEEQPPVDGNKAGRKRPRASKAAPSDRHNEIQENDGPMSHQDYIDKRRKEVGSSQAYEELTANVLGTCSSRMNLVEYESDGSASSECEKKDDHPVGHLNEVDRVKSRSEQRYPLTGEPVCVVCGRYGEYICNETDDDICSMECKSELLENLKLAARPFVNQKPDISSSGLNCALPMPDFGEDTWDYDRHRWSKRRSNLCSYECWKCQKPGHLAEDCLVMTSNQVALGQNKSSTIHRNLLGLYKRCHQMGRNLSSAQCNACRISFSLATCLHCSTVLCDSAGHLNEHIKTQQSHREYFSHKLKRLVKCCKSTCSVTDIKDLLACHYCFDKAFEKFYDMYTATWKEAGLSIIQGSICCEDHFAWHRMNCLNPDAEDNAYIISQNIQKDKLIQISDFIF